MRYFLILALFVISYHDANSQFLDGEVFKSEIFQIAERDSWELIDSSATQLKYRNGKYHLIRFNFKLSQVAKRLDIFYKSNPDELGDLYKGLIINCFMDGYSFQSHIVIKENFVVVTAVKPNQMIKIKAFLRSVHVEVSILKTRWIGDHEPIRTPGSSN